MNSIEILTLAALFMDDALARTTGLKAWDRKLIVYWTLATHALPWLDRFPLLVLMGKMGTGKSRALDIIRIFAMRASAFSMRSRTLPVIRDSLEACANGTAVIEEGDQAWKDEALFERMLSDRYHRASAEAGLKAEVGRGNWMTVTKRYFGATVLHRRIPFADPALNGRSVFVHFRADHSRNYEEIG